MSIKKNNSKVATFDVVYYSLFIIQFFYGVLKSQSLYIKNLFHLLINIICIIILLNFSNNFHSNLSLHI